MTSQKPKEGGAFRTSGSTRLHDSRAFLVHIRQPVALANGRTRRIESVEKFLESLGLEVHRVALLDSTLPRPLRFIRHVKTLKSLFEVQRPSVVVYMGLELGPLTRISPRQPNLVDVCDSSNELAKNRSSVLGRFEAKLSLLVLWGLTHKKARVTYITLDDLEMDRSRIRGRRSAVLENALNRKLSSVEPISQMKRRLGYFADWDYEPNRKGLLWVVAELGQWLSINDWELHLFGPGTLEKEQPAWITVHGFIEDLPSAYGSVDLTIAPDFWGAGYKNKVGESLLAARPVLTTPIGIRGQSSHQGIYLFTDRQSALSQLEQISNSDEIAAASRGLRISSLKINQDDERYLLLRKSLGLESVHNGQ